MKVLYQRISLKVFLIEKIKIKMQNLGVLYDIRQNQEFFMNREKFQR